MEAQLVAVSVCCFFVTFAHIIGLVILFKRRDSIIHGTQKYLIVALSLTELNMVVFSVIRDVAFFISGSTDDKFGITVRTYSAVVPATLY